MIITNSIPPIAAPIRCARGLKHRSLTRLGCTDRTAEDKTNTANYQGLRRPGLYVPGSAFRSHQQNAQDADRKYSALAMPAEMNKPHLQSRRALLESFNRGDHQLTNVDAASFREQQDVLQY